MIFFLEFSITHRIETKRNDNFLFSLFPILFQPILAWNEFIMVFFNFLNFFFLIFYYVSGRNGTERKFLFYLIHILFHPIFARNFVILVFFLYVEFFGYFLEILYYALGRNVTKRKFLFLSFSYFSNLFWLEMNSN